jgi:hypothetical protein
MWGPHSSQRILLCSSLHSPPEPLTYGLPALPKVRLRPGPNTLHAYAHAAMPLTHPVQPHINTTGVWATPEHREGDVACSAERHTHTQLGK